MTIRTALPFAAASLGVLLATAPSASAEIFNACEVMAPLQGIAILRKSPSPYSPIVAVMVPGQILVIEKTETSAVSDGKWFKVSHYPGIEMPNPGDPNYPKVRTGWVHQNFVGECG